MPGFYKARKASARFQAKSQFQQLAMALENYQLEYGRYPSFLSENPIKLTDPKVAQELMEALSAKKSALNERGIGFYSFSEKEYRNGVLLEGFNNPNIYIAVDNDGDGVIENEQMPTQDTKLHANVAIFSLTSDGKKNDIENVYSWE